MADTKLLTIHVRVTNQAGEFLDSGECSIGVASTVANDDYDAMFEALRIEYPELYDDYPDCKFEITEVEDDD